MMYGDRKTMDFSPSLLGRTFRAVTLASTLLASVAVPFHIQTAAAASLKTGRYEAPNGSVIEVQGKSFYYTGKWNGEPVRRKPFVLELRPGASAEAALCAIRLVRDGQALRVRHQAQVAKTKKLLDELRLPVLETPTHIIPLMVGDADKCKAASDRLLNLHSIYIQPINYPTVPRGTERLRITPSPVHDDVQIAALGHALDEVWTHLDLARKPTALAAE